MLDIHDLLRLHVVCEQAITLALHLGHLDSLSSYIRKQRLNVTLLLDLLRV